MMLVKGRIPSLDGFRAISILLVIFYHLLLTNTFSPDIKNIFEQFIFGKLGVRIFFVISGFLITYLLLKERAEKGSYVDLKAFYIRRFLRIFPVYYFYLFTLSVLNCFINLEISPLVILSGSLYIQNFAPWGSHWLVAHSFSLAVEEQFYLLWPVIFLRINKLNNILIWLAVLALGSSMRIFYYKYPDLSSYFLAPFLKHADFLFSGCFIAFYSFYHYERLVKFINRVRPVFIYILILLILIFSKFEFHPIYDKFFIPTSGAIVNICISFLILYFIIRGNSIGYKFLNLPFMESLGRMSYSLYIWQQLFISGYEYWWARFPQNIILTFLTAYFSYQVIEKPFLRYKDKLKIVLAK